ncbi:MAG TPA: CRTAC1 family protein [Gemmataceae bacterium]|nr:CRTAC1 family protein [Gemmataceae bacterium]
MRDERSLWQQWSSASSLRTGVLLILVSAPFIGGCGRTAVPKALPAVRSSVQRRSFFEDVTQAKGLPAKATNWPDGTFATPEVTAGGVALFDYDNDGRLDILQICHGRPGRFDERVPMRLFHQESDGTFREVPHAGGLSAPGYAHGVAIGDYNNDGYPDVYITTYGRNALFRNNGDGTFTDVTAAAGLATREDSWSSSAAWLDYDRDGHLDLFVVHFAKFDPSRVCPGDDGQRDYCGPSQFQGVLSGLYHNNGDGTFTDVTAKAGINYPGRGWGVVCADLTGDGWVDIFVANDEERQNLWVNQHDGTFKDEAVVRGVAYNGAGRPEAGMGVAVGDVANDGRWALFITHIRGEKNTMYTQSANGMYIDGSASAGMAAPGLTYTGWGCGFVDLDNDGNLDLAIANGRVSRGPLHPKATLGKFWNAYAENNLLLRGDGHGRFTDITARGGDFTTQIDNTRGLALGDIDSDGRIDLVTNTVDNTLRVFRNVVATEGNHWLLVRALTGKRDALGARVEVSAGDRRWTRLVLAAYSFCSSCDPRAHFGLGKMDHVDAIDVSWPDGQRERFAAPKVDGLVTVQQGKGQRLP